MKIGISLPMLNQPAERFAELAALADDAGLESVWDYEFFRNPFITHGLNARATSRITLATGIATACSRSPFEMANAAADIDELSGGRALLGMASGGAGWTDVCNGAEIDRPLSRMREYVTAVRAIWDHMADGEPYAFEGEFFRTASPPFNPWGGRELARPRIPIYLGGLKPAMLGMIGEVADGYLGYLCTPEFLRDYVRPKLAASGRDIEIAALVLCSVNEDRAVARRLARINVGNYVAYPVSAPVVEFMGMQEDRDAVVGALMQQGPAALETAASDALVDMFSISGKPDEAAEQLAAFDGALDHIVLHTPYVPPITGAESEAAFRNTVDMVQRVGQYVRT
jgi:alkanesulfonate monooxygenase SsuD/methylene tetrahydromethanopterin reductase-like flavin-dependent oxidoreductase (luciferase family)